MEVWKDVKGYEGLYQVSNLGQIKSLGRWVKHTGWRFEEEKILKPSKTNAGYLYVQLSKNSIGKKFKVHRLVAEAFIPNPDNLPTINHRNENKCDNRADNLEWMTVKDNSNYGSRNKNLSKTLLNHPTKSKPVIQYTIDGVFIKEWPSVSEVKRAYNFDNSTISDCCIGKFKQAYGYVWKFKQAS